MKNAIRIFKRDMKNIFTNVIATTIVIGLMIVPSLYSLVNIKACWDPYASESTSNIKIAVVNGDKGTTFHDQEINVGNKIIDNLKENDKIGWTFVDKETAKDGLIKEKYYAMIEIPEDFSSDVISVTEKKVVKPKLIYTVNEKKNAIAPKITDSGVKTLKQQVSENVTKTISGIIIRVCNDIGVDIENNRPELRRIVDAVYELDENMPEIESILDASIEGTVNGSKLNDDLESLIPSISDTLDATDIFIDNMKENLDTIEGNLSDDSVVVKENLVESERLLDNLSIELNNIDENIIPEVYKKSLLTGADVTSASIESAQELKSNLKSMKKFINKLSKIELPKPSYDEETQTSEEIEKLKSEYKKQTQVLKDLQKNLKDTSNTIDNVINRLDFIEDKLNILSNRIDADLDDIENGKKLDTQSLTDTRKVVDEMHTLLSDLIDSYDSEIVNGVSKTFDEANNVIDNVSYVLNQSRDTLPDLEDLTNTLRNVLNLSNDELMKVKDKFPDMKADLHKMADKLREYDDDDKLDEILDIITNGYEDQSNFLANAVELEDNRLFPWPNYGSTVTPFYTVLCLWVGGLLLSSLLSTDAKDFDDGTEIKPYERYFGRLFLYLFIGVFQALVATGGALVLLKSYCLHPIMVLFYSVFVSFVFITIIYTATSLFRNVGKVIAIVLLVLQVAGSGGNFPIEVAPKFFRTLFPFLPFTYAIGGMRQIMAGIVYEILIKDIIILLIFAIVSIILGATLKKFINDKINYFTKRLGESGIVGH